MVVLNKQFSFQLNGSDEEMMVNRRTSFVGTAQYVSPEMLTNSGEWLYIILSFKLMEIFINELAYEKRNDIWECV